MSRVKSSKARAWPTSTTTSRRMASTVSIMLLAFPIRRCTFLKGRERTFPEAVQVAAELGQALGIGLVEPAGADLAVEDQADVLEHLEMLGDGRTADRQHVGQLSHGQRAGGEVV